MNKVIVFLFAFAVLPAYASEPASPAQPAAASQQPSAQPAAAATTGSVARAQFTTAVENREPVDKVSNLLNDKTRVYFFTEIKDAPNQKVTHRWEHNGKVMSEVNFDVGSSRWRVFSSKTLDPSWTGEWKVTVLDEAGSTLAANTFTYEDAPASASQPTNSPAPNAPAAAQPLKP